MERNLVRWISFRESLVNFVWDVNLKDWEIIKEEMFKVCMDVWKWRLNESKVWSYIFRNLKLEIIVEWLEIISMGFCWNYGNI